MKKTYLIPEMSVYQLELQKSVLLPMSDTTTGAGGALAPQIEDFEDDLDLENNF